MKTPKTSPSPKKEKEFKLAGLSMSKIHLKALQKCGITLTTYPLVNGKSKEPVVKKITVLKSDLNKETPYQIQYENDKPIKMKNKETVVNTLNAYLRDLKLFKEEPIKKEEASKKEIDKTVSKGKAA